MRVAIALCLLALTVPSAARAEVCAIEGIASGITITVREAGERGYRRVRLERPTRVAMTPMRTGVSAIRVLEGEPVEGMTGAVLPVAFARAVSLRDGTIDLPAGLPISRVRAVEQGPWVEVDVALGDGLHLRRAAVPCSALALASSDRPIAGIAPFSWSGPRWRARTTRMTLFDAPEADGAMRLEVAPEAAARFVELDRRTPWVRVALRTSLGARLRGWVRDWDLIR